MRKIKDIPWTVPDEIKNYIQFQATNDPVCPWAEGLAKKHHSLAVLARVFGEKDALELWGQYFDRYGIAEVNPDSLREFCEWVIVVSKPSYQYWTKKLDEVLP